MPNLRQEVATKNYVESRQFTGPAPKFWVHAWEIFVDCFVNNNALLLIHSANNCQALLGTRSFKMSNLDTVHREPAVWEPVSPHSNLSTQVCLIRMETHRMDRVPASSVAWQVPNTAGGYVIQWWVRVVTRDKQDRSDSQRNQRTDEKGPNLTMHRPQDFV